MDQRYLIWIMQYVWYLYCKSVIAFIWCFAIHLCYRPPQRFYEAFFTFWCVRSHLDIFRCVIHFIFSTNSVLNVFLRNINFFTPTISTIFFTMSYHVPHIQQEKNFRVPLCQRWIPIFYVCESPVLKTHFSVEKKMLFILNFFFFFKVPTLHG